MKSIQIFTYDHCPYCEAAKALMRDRQITFEETPVSRNDSTQIQGLVKRSGMRTFPQIFVGDTLIGGFSELQKLDQEGKLLPLLS